METSTLLKVFAGCAGLEIGRFFLPNSCVAATAITMDVMSHYGRTSEQWEVCLQVDGRKCHVDVGCSDPESDADLGGHLVTIVEGRFLVDASFAQIRTRCLDLPSPRVFVGELRPAQPPVQNRYEFPTPWAMLRYRSRQITRDWRHLPDWGSSPERDAAKAGIVSRIEMFCAQQNLAWPSVTKAKAPPTRD